MDVEYQKRMLRRRPSSGSNSPGLRSRSLSRTSSPVKTHRVFTFPSSVDDDCCHKLERERSLSPAKGHRIYSDRHIPSRSASSAFSMMASHTPPSSPERRTNTMSTVGSDGVNNNANRNTTNSNHNHTTYNQGSGGNPIGGDDSGRNTYAMLLRNELLGDHVDSAFAVDNSSDVGLTASTMPNAMATGFDNGIRNGGGGVVGVSTGIGQSSNTVLAPQTVVRNVFQYQSQAGGGSFYGNSSGGGYGLRNSDAASPYSLTPLGEASQKLLISPRRQVRKIPKVPFKVLDAPDLQDDFYLNLVDWSSQNMLGVGLGTCVYLWSACTSAVTKLCDLRPDDGVTSVSWMQRGTHIAVGTGKGDVQIWDVSKCRKVRSMEGHTARVGTVAWNSHVLVSGSRDRSILHRDVRAPVPFISKLYGHRQEVCGLKWSPDSQQLASGGNDNRLYVWNPSFPNPIQRYTEHTAAVKAICWSPHQHGLLASGGGTQCRHIRFWNTLTGQPLQAVDTGSQVCNLAWSSTTNELVSTHGYSQNQIVVWRYPSMTQVATLTGHTYRVLYLAMSPNGETIVTGAGDETLRFWNVFSKAREPKDPKSVLGLFSHIR